jgi:anti-sigma regulatory factor (Ser/Thr protein kinase)
MDRVEVRIVNRLEEISRVADMVECFGAEHAIPSEVVNDVNVVLDEALSNVMSYGYDSDAESEIIVRLTYQPGEIGVEIEDSGRPFDPLQASPPDFDKPVHERSVGGLGIHFIKSLMDEVSYARVGGKNRLHLKKKSPAA